MAIVAIWIAGTGGFAPLSFERCYIRCTAGTEEICDGERTRNGGPQESGRAKLWGEGGRHGRIAIVFAEDERGFTVFSPDGAEGGAGRGGSGGIRMDPVGEGPRRGAHPEEGEYTLRHGVRAYDWILEVIDPREDRVVARKKLDWIPLALLDGGLPYPLVRI